MRYSHNYCAICYTELRRPQNTCGSFECRDAWKFLGRDARKSHLNLAAMPPSERAYCLAEGPSEEELEAKAQARESLNEELSDYQANQQKAETPKFLREMMAPANLQPLIKEERNDSDTVSDSPNPTK